MRGCQDMTNNWCHGPSCHTIQTQSRVRGSGDNKVLRTIKIKHDSNYRSNEYYSMFNYFCNQSCLMEFVEHNIQGMIALAPRREALETPINDPKKETIEYSYGNNTRTIKNKLDTEVIHMYYSRVLSLEEESLSN